MLILPRLSPKLYLFEIFETRLSPPPKRLNISLYTPRTQISRSPQMVKPLIKKLEKKKDRNTVVKSKLGKISSQLFVSVHLALPVGLVRTLIILPLKA